jgi:hypothetical protein
VVASVLTPGGARSIFSMHCRPDAATAVAKPLAVRLD